MSQPLISVCIVTYNHQAYIADCLMGVLAQWGDFRLEILVGDDASADATASIVRQIAAQHPGIIRLFSHPQNLGPSENCHFLIEQAQGDFVAHLDGDDFWLPGKLQAQYQFLLDNPDCPACYTNALVVTNEKKPWGIFSPPTPARISLEQLVQSGNFLNNSSMLYRAQYRATLLAFPSQLIDYRIHLLFAQHGALGIINQPLTAYRLNSATSSQNNHLEKFLLLYTGALLSTQDQANPASFRQGILHFLQGITVNLIAKRQRELLRKVLETINRQYPISTTTLMLHVIPQSLWNDLKYFYYKRISGRELRFLHRSVPQGNHP
jgi:glycosyltransferase involved in cell wall biosynthesis